MTAKTEPMTAEDRAFAADTYRQASFDLLHAARRLRDVGERIRQTRVKVAEAAVTDLAEAKAILACLPTVRVKGPADRA